MPFVGIVASGLVSGSYYNGGGASDIDALKTRKFTWHSVRTSQKTPLRVFWEPTPSFTHRRHFVRFASLLSRRTSRVALVASLCFAFSVRYVLPGVQLKSVRPHNVFKFKFTAIAVRSSTYLLFTPLRIFWEPAPSFTNRRHFVRFVSLLSRRVASRSLCGKFYRAFNLKIWDRTICSNLNLPP